MLYGHKYLYRPYLSNEEVDSVSLPYGHVALLRI